MKQQMLEKEVAELKQQVIDLINQNAELIKDKARIKRDLYTTLYEGEWSSDSWNLVDQIRSEIETQDKPHTLEEFTQDFINTEMSETYGEANKTNDLNHIDGLIKDEEVT